MSDAYNSAQRFAPIGIPAAPSASTLYGYTVTSAVTTAALQVIPSAAGYAGPGGIEGDFDFYATGAEAYVLFGPDAASTAPATLLCMPVPVGVYQRWFINGNRRFLTVIATGAGTLRWAPVSGR